MVLVAAAAALCAIHGPAEPAGPAPAHAGPAPALGGPGAARPDDRSVADASPGPRAVSAMVSGTASGTVSAMVPGPRAYRDGYARIPLYADGVTVGVDGLPDVVPVGYRPASTVVGGLVQDVWLAEGSVPGPQRYADLAERALRDLDALVLPSGAAVAGLAEGWRYVWPRDASFAAAALAATDHPDDAFEVLAHLQGLQDVNAFGGVFQARYLPDGSGAVPDGRGAQLDGDGWVLWAVSAWYDAARQADGAGAAAADLERLRPLVTRSVAAIRANVGADGLPTVSPDYWEVRETTPTLGCAAALLLGARAAGPLLARLGEAPVDDVVAALEGGIRRAFAPGYPRHAGEWARDTSVAFLMPPFAPEDAEVSEAWQAAARSMTRPAGGLAPGAAWKQDGVSWTPTTALFALTAAASGDRDQAVAWLDWLDEHRTDLGSLPEKVLWDGSPSAAAPLAWTCAVVLLALHELDVTPSTGPAAV